MGRKFNNELDFLDHTIHSFIMDGDKGKAKQRLSAGIVNFPKKSKLFKAVSDFL